VDARRTSRQASWCSGARPPSTAGAHAAPCSRMDWDAGHPQEATRSPARSWAGTGGLVSVRRTSLIIPDPRIGTSSPHPPTFLCRRHLTSRIDRSAGDDLSQNVIAVVLLVVFNLFGPLVAEQLLHTLIRSTPRKDRKGRTRSDPTILPTTVRRPAEVGYPCAAHADERSRPQRGTSGRT
jgi:hypothetical protein